MVGVQFAKPNTSWVVCVEESVLTPVASTNILFGTCLIGLAGLGRKLRT